LEKGFKLVGILAVLLVLLDFVRVLGPTLANWKRLEWALIFLHFCPAARWLGKHYEVVHGLCIRRGTRMARAEHF
jgi:hypothetical protein